MINLKAGTQFLLGFVLIFTLGAFANVAAVPTELGDAAKFKLKILEQERKALQSHEDIEISDLVIPAPALLEELRSLSTRLAKIDSEQRPSLTFLNCRITGDLTITGKISLRLQFNGVTFEGVVTFKDAQLDQDLNLANFCTFKQPVFIESSSLRTIDMGFDNRETYFLGPLQISKTTFAGSPRFSKAVFRHAVEFENTEFKDGAEFDGVSFEGGVHFSNVVFGNDTYFTGATFGQNTEFGVTFEKDANFVKARFNNMAMFRRSKFKGQAEFGDAHFAAAEFGNAVFSDETSFNHAKFDRYAGFPETRFAGEVDFEGCSFPSILVPSREGEPGVSFVRPGVVFSQTRFEKRARLTFEQLVDMPTWRPFTNPRTKLKGVNEDMVRTWENFKETFQNTNDLSSRNEAEYQRRLWLSVHPDTTARQAIYNRFERVFWGYGYRPGRVAFWLILSYAVFTLIYWTQTRGISVAGRWTGFWKRLKFAGRFSWLTAYKLTFGWENSRTWPFKIITMLQSIGTKVMLFFFFKSLANISPLFSELVNKVLP